MIFESVYLGLDEYIGILVLFRCSDRPDIGVLIRLLLFLELRTLMDIYINHQSSTP